MKAILGRVRHEPILLIGLISVCITIFKDIKQGEPVAGTTLDSLWTVLAAILGRTLVTPNSKITKDENA